MPHQRYARWAEEKFLFSKEKEIMEDILRDDIPEVNSIPHSAFQSISRNNANAEIDRELEEILKRQAARIKVIGVGGGGGNTVSRMREIGIKGGEIIAINTDAQDLLYTNADQKILIGREISKGLGAGSNPRIGAEAAKEQEQEIKKKLANSDLVFVTCGLGGGCLRGSSLVSTVNGPKKISSIKKGEDVFTFYKNKLVKRKVLASMKTGIKKVYEIKTKNRTLIASFDHPFLKVKPLNKLSSDRFSKFKLEWTKAKDLKKDDFVVVLRDTSSEGTTIEIPTGTSDEEFCKLFGFLIGDGWISRSKDSWKIHFSPSIDKKQNNYYAKLIEKYFNIKMKSTPSANWLYGNSKKAYEFLDKIGLNHPANKKEIPKWVFNLPREQKKAFIVGLADADAHYLTQTGSSGLPKKEIRFEMSSEKLIKQLKILCDEIGLRTCNISSRTRPIKAPNSKVAKNFTAWNLRIYKTQELLGDLPHPKTRNGLSFIYKYRSRKKHEIFENFGFNRISSVIELDDEEVYDITVDKSHNFIAEGFIVHNTGTGAAPVVAEIAKKQGALVIGVVTLPFTVEGAKRIENAMEGLERMEGIVDTLIVIPNDKLLDLAPDLPLPTAFKVADEILTNAVKGITELVTSSGLVNLDFADIKTIMANGGVSLIGMGESDSNDRANEAVDKALNNPLLDVDIKNAQGALVNVIGGMDLSLDEYKQVVQRIGEQLSPDAKLISGAQISKDMEKSLKVMVIITGVKSPQISGERVPVEEARRRDMEGELGIEFFDE